MPDDTQAQPANTQAAAATDRPGQTGADSSDAPVSVPESPQTAPSAPASPEAAAIAPQPAGMVGLPSAPPLDISVKHMFLNADPVVQIVMVILLLASAATWMVIFEKAAVLRRTSRNIMLFKRTVSAMEGPLKADDFMEAARPIVRAGLRESADASGRETRSDYRERVERSMRAELAGLMDRVGKRTTLLASVGSVSPFIGLFGTVWGIMHSFIGIAASGETTLAVVAPGIAEALFATAMGLAAAIPAVIAYNKITGTLKKITKEALAAIGVVGNRLARDHFRAAESEL